MADDRYIQDLLKDLREHRSSAARSLGNIAFEGNQASIVVNALTAALNDSNDNVRIWAIVALRELAARHIDISSALPAIEKALDDEEEDVILNAVDFFKAYNLAELPLRNRLNIKLKISDSEKRTGERRTFQRLSYINYKIEEKDYVSALKKIKKMTQDVMGRTGNRSVLKKRNELLSLLAELTEKIHAKMNPLDKKEPMKWQKPVAKAPAKKVNKRVMAK